MEPNLIDLDDYDKPLSLEKFLSISTAILLLSSFYVSVAMVIELGS